ncbi:MAG TPA: prepilin-type N-terminal cleavage/methylation domain-containing protein [Mollicutes bacterium]|mgnify:CR=1 FL=1|nr:prepilin-type N-terminal cleavage/methylation domain-containing protein [Mollicutes bacterium]
MKKGFTLIELLAVIVILSVVAIVVIPKIQEVLFDSQDNAYNLLVTRIENKANDYLIDKDLANQVITGIPLDIYLSDLIEEGYLETKELVDPREEKKHIQPTESYVRFSLEEGNLNYKAYLVIR